MFSQLINWVHFICLWALAAFHSIILLLIHKTHVIIASARRMHWKMVCNNLFKVICFLFLAPKLVCCCKCPFLSALRSLFGWAISSVLEGWTLCKMLLCLFQLCIYFFLFYIDLRASKFLCVTFSHALGLNSVLNILYKLYAGESYS